MHSVKRFQFRPLGDNLENDTYHRMPNGLIFEASRTPPSMGIRIVNRLQGLIRVEVEARIARNKRTSR